MRYVNDSIFPFHFRDDEGYHTIAPKEEFDSTRRLECGSLREIKKKKEVKKNDD